VSFFGDEKDGREDSASLDWIDAGGLPPAAERRIAELTGAPGAFTSTLSASEFALLRECGAVPAAQVLGASVFQVGWQYLPADAQSGGSTYRCQLDGVSRAWDLARRRAFDRLTQEARAVGADAVVGVRLRRGDHDWVRGAVDLVISGTAIRSMGCEPEAPVLSDLSGQQFWALRSRGWAPVGLVASTSVMFIALGRGVRWRRRFSTASNQELHEFSDGATAARQLAVRGLSSQARTAKADGIVGVSFEHNLTRRKFTVASGGKMAGQRPTGIRPYTWALGADVPTRGADKRDGLVITVHAVGTAIRRSDQPASATFRRTINLGAR
jgi:uncharacterized protein YbjQ (UPF0145 family)